MEIPHQEKQKERKINPEISRRSKLSTSLIVKPAAINIAYKTLLKNKLDSVKTYSKGRIGLKNLWTGKALKSTSRL